MGTRLSRLFLATLTAWLFSLPLAFVVVDAHGSGISRVLDRSLPPVRRLRIGRDAAIKIALRPYALLYGRLCHAVRLPIDPQNGVYGKEGWAFLGNGYERCLDQSVRKAVLSDAEADGLARRGQALAALAKRHGAEMLVLVAPNKGALYPERLPCPPRPGPSSLDKWMARAPGLLVDVHAALRAAKARAPMASPLDTHWSDAAAGVAWGVLRERFGRRFPVAASWRPEGQPFGLRWDAGDLPRIMSFRARNPVATLPLPATHGIRVAPDGQRSPVDGPCLVDAPLGPQSVEHPAAPIPKHLLVIGDSNVRALSPYLNAAFRQVSYHPLLWRSPETPFDELLGTVRPDLVLWVVAERHLLTLWLPATR